eukprot:Transcript_12038.p1 GENE.Transcript_12038~~Transcript_12038.p1  ORF type:complete len:568 (-),score=-8.54 Transcript_12038:247-1950(-)
MHYHDAISCGAFQNTSMPPVSSASQCPETTMMLLGEVIHTPPMTTGSCPSNTFLRFLPQLRNVSWEAYSLLHAPRSDWVIHAQRGHPLRVAVLGTSPTAGCNACIGGTLPVNHTCVACDARYGWARRLADRLTEMLKGVVSPYVHIQFKNAVGPGYFEHCTASKVPRDTHLVLLEVATNLWGTHPRGLLAAIRKAAPRAAIAFVAWTSQQALKAEIKNHAGPRLGSADIARIDEAAREHEADIFRVGHVLARLGAGPKLTYSDEVHPNALGHEMLGELAAQFIVWRLRDAACAVRLPSSKPAASSTTTSSERCFPEADTMPVNVGESTGWKLVDEGRSKGVRKLGWLSLQPGGQPLRVGPLEDAMLREPDSMCTRFRVDLGFHLQPSFRTPSIQQGAIKISCLNCTCSRLPVAYTAKIFPFPVVETDSKRASEAALRRNISVTSTTAFEMRTQVGRPCWLLLQHLWSNMSQTTSGSNKFGFMLQSRVRVDNLALSYAKPVFLTAFHHFIHGRQYKHLLRDLLSCEKALATRLCNGRNSTKLSFRGVLTDKETETDLAFCHQLVRQGL